MRFGFVSPASFDLPGSQKQPDSVPEMGEDAVTSVSPSFAPPVLSEEERQELQEELIKVRRGIILKITQLYFHHLNTDTSLSIVWFGPPVTRPDCFKPLLAAFNINRNAHFTYFVACCCQSSLRSCQLEIPIAAFTTSSSFDIDCTGGKQNGASLLL